MTPNVASILIVGAGPAGVGAAVEAARQGTRALWVDRTGFIGGTIGLAHEVCNVPFLPVSSGAEVVDGLRALANRWRLELRRGEITSLHVEPFGVRAHLDDGSTCDARTAVVATGTAARHPLIAGLEPGFGFPLLASAREAWEQLHPTQVGVIGGSDVALDQARWLRHRGAAVTLLARHHVRGPTWLLDLARAEGVVIVEGAQIVFAEHTAAGVLARVDTSDGTRLLEVSCLVAAVGRIPELPAGDFAGHATVQVVGDATGRSARHVVVAMGDGTQAAALLLAQLAEERST